MKKFISATVFFVISVVLFPISILGYLIWVGKGVFSGNPSGVSATAQGPVFARWTMDEFGTRSDAAASKLMALIPGISPTGRILVTFPTLLAHRLSGYVPKAFRYPFEGEISKQFEASARVSFFDDVVERYLPRIDQFVILGAGFDTRPYRLPSDTLVRSFEVDEPKTQAVKRDMLAKAGIDTSKVTFVSADFEKEDWLAKLVECGFDMARPALFLWEGVILYLDRAAVDDTLRKIASTPKGSAVAFDYFTTVALESKSLYWRYARAGTKAAGEPIKFGIDATPPSRDRVAELLASCGLTLTEQRTLGKESDTERAWAGFAVAEVE